MGLLYLYAKYRVLYTTKSYSNESPLYKNMQSIKVTSIITFSESSILIFLVDLHLLVRCDDFPRCVCLKTARLLQACPVNSGALFSA